MLKEKIIWDNIHVGNRIYREGYFGLKHFVRYEWFEDAIAYYRMFVTKRI